MKFNEARKLAIHLKKFDKEISNMVTIMGNEALNHFIKSFSDQGFTDESLKWWRPRKKVGGGQQSRAILIQTGRLRRSLKKTRIGKYAIRISTDVPYAKIHNEGAQTGYVFVKPHTRKQRSRDVHGIVSASRGGGKTRSRLSTGIKFGVLKEGKAQMGGHSRKLRMPKRQFMGKSAELNRKIISRLGAKIKKYQ